MKVAVLAAEMEGQPTGVGRYLEGLLEGLGSWAHGAEWHLFFQGQPFSSPGLDKPGVHAHFSCHHGSRVVWEQVRVTGAIEAIAPDVVLGPAYTLPFGLRSPSVVVIHDLSFEILANEFRPRERWRRRLLARRAARVANRIITDTGYLSSMVVDRYGVDDQRVAVVPLGVDRSRFAAEAADSDDGVLSELNLRRPFVLVPGTVLERRLPRQVLEAFSRVRDAHPDLELVIAGANRMRRPRMLDRWISELGTGNAVRQLGWVEEDRLAPLYRMADMAVYVSRHEGFGLPPVECLACGTPVVVSKGLGLDDVWPDYPYRIADLGVEAIAGMMTAILTDRDRETGFVERAETATADLGWEECSQRLMAELQRVVGP